MMTVKQVSNITGVSIRTLQYYDNIGLLKATGYSAAGYRLYDEAALEKLQQILLFRELEFSLKDIQAILSREDFDRKAALQNQIELLQMKKSHIEGLIALARKLQEEGAQPMEFSPFDKTKMEAYTREAKARWGHTDAYAQSREKSRGRTPEQEQILGAGLMDIFARLGQIRDTTPDAPAAQSLVKELQSYITEHYYTCTKQILLGLGQMYAAGGEFTENINNAGGAGTARFANEAIRVYCK